MVYFLYPETAGRSLEDIDLYYQGNPSLLVFRDKEVTRTARPQKYMAREEEEMRRNSSAADPGALRRASRVSGRQMEVAQARLAGNQGRESEEYEGKTDVGEGETIRHKEDA
jgi:hypothetical protein